MQFYGIYDVCRECDNKTTLKILSELKSVSAICRDQS